MTTYMLDTCICSFIIRERPFEVLQRLSDEVARHNRIVISSITYAEMRYGMIRKNAPIRLAKSIEQFVARIDGILAWDAAAVDETARVYSWLSAAGLLISRNDTAIAGHALASDCVLVSDNTREFARISDLPMENWVMR